MLLPEEGGVPLCFPVIKCPCFMCFMQFKMIIPTLRRAGVALPALNRNAQPSCTRNLGVSSTIGPPGCVPSKGFPGV